MLFNGDYTFLNSFQFSMLFNRNFCILSFFHPCYSMEIIEIFIFCQFLMIFNCAIGFSNLIKQKSPCVLQDIVPFGAAALLTITYIDKHTKQGNGYRWLHIALGRLVWLFSRVHATLWPALSVCRSVGPSVRRSVGPPVCRSVSHA